jgi:hypothetical protein
MKMFFLSLSIFMATFLDAQVVTFSKLLVGEFDKYTVEMLELPNEDLMVVSVENFVSRNGNTHSKIYFFNKNGQLKDSLLFKDSTRSLIIYKIVPTKYGYQLLGSMKESNQLFFWNAKLDAQFRITNQQFTSTNLNRIIAESYTITNDSDIVVLIALEVGTNPPYHVGKINKQGVLTLYNKSATYSSIPVSIFERKDSSGYFILDDIEWKATDSAFNTLHKKSINLTYNGASFTPNFQPTGMRKNDSTYFYSGRWLERNGRRNRDLVFLTLNTLGQVKFAKTIVAGGDTSFRQAGIKCIDTTKDGRFIYWGGSTNWDMFNPTYALNQGSLILTKLDSNYQTVWQKNYGANAYYLMEGVLPTKDGGCVMYGERYDYNLIPKVDAIIIKVDGNGTVTSETSIPITTSNIIPYPNPSNGQLQFKKEDPSVSSTFDLNLYDMSGKLVFQKRETDLSETFDLSHLSEGNYLYQIKKQEQIISVGKWIKVKN